ncbi:MAG: (d)CMP kinase [Proteobacteria bacterium]|nr:(d)CMP kinase [Pseudomonadota bacterium]
MIIAIDGPAGAGKGTISKFLSYQLDFATIDTGLFYRALGYSVMNASASAVSNLDYLIKKAQNITLNDLSNPDLRLEDVANIASQISVNPIIRDVITNKIRSLATDLLKSYKGVILDGRDVTTVIFPNADVKLYITADKDVRANRRKNEANNSSIKAQVSMLITERDERDSTRKVAPLQKADGSVEIDTTDLSIEEACAKALQVVNNMSKGN